MGFFNAGSWQSKGTSQPSIARCGLCGLYKKCYSPKMPPTGSGRRRILFVAEAPGEQEDRQGVQLVGEPGQLLRQLLHNIGEELDDCWKTNAVICHPPENKMHPDYIQSCRPNLLSTIKTLQPRVIILLGESAMNSLITPLWKKDFGSVTRWVGWTIPLETHHAWVCPTFHPSYLLRQEGDELLKEITQQHLRAAFKLYETPVKVADLDKLKEQVEIIQKERLAKAQLRDLLSKKGRLAFDYETTGLKPENEQQRIVSCSFCFEGEKPFAFPMTEGVRRLVSKVLRSPALEKVASNLKFEERWTLAKFGHGVANWGWDTMLAAHCLDNRPAVCSIKFQAFIHLGVGDYNSHVDGLLHSESANELNRIHEIDMKDLLLYNGLDSLLEFMVMEKQRELLK